MVSKMLHGVLPWLLVFLVTSSAPFSANSGISARAQTVPIARQFSLPLGYRDGVSYGPHINFRNGKLIEDTEYGVKNPDMQGITCFGLDWWKLYHAGEDWYREDGKSTSQAEVTAVADGIVKYISYNFPGAVIIIRHRLPPDGQQKIFSLYGHLDPNSVLVSVSQVVTRGQKLGTVLHQYYDGRNTGYHDDSHLHFEMRYFYNASDIYDNYPACNGYIPGRGYTYPEIPDSFPPSQLEHYTDPIAYIQRIPRAFLPLIIQMSPPEELP
jgi:murein DD-endopeptidase MepM/ murein hydrolase activator NlpD